MIHARRDTSLPPGQETLRQRLARVAKTRSGPFGRLMNNTWLSYRTLSLPFPSLYGRVLRAEKDTRIAVWGLFKRMLYYDPLFRASCERVGRRLHLVGAPPLVVGEGRIVVGDDVTISSFITFAFSRQSGRRAVLSIGDRSVVSWGVSIFVADQVIIGAGSIIGPCTR